MRHIVPLLLLLIPSAILAQECIDYGSYVPAEVAYTPISGDLTAFDAAGDYLCYARTATSTNQRSLNWCGLGDDGVPVPQGYYEFDGEKTALVRVDGTRAAALQADGSCLVVDFADSDHPELVAVAEAHGSRPCLDFVDGLVAIAEDSSVVFCRIADGALLEVGRYVAAPRYPLTGTVKVHSFDVTGGLCWLVTRDDFFEGIFDLTLLDISDPTSPVRLGSRELAANSWPSSTTFRPVSADGPRACLCSQTTNLDMWSEEGDSYRTVVYTYSAEAGIGERIVLSSEASSARILGEYVYAANTQLTYYRNADDRWPLVGSWACTGAAVAASTRGVWVGNATGIGTYLPSLPAAWPHLGAVYTSSGLDLGDMHSAGGHLLVQTQTPSCDHCSQGSALMVLAPETPTLLVPAGNIAEQGGYNASHVVDGNLVYTTAGIWDLSTRAMVSSFSTRALAVVGRTLWATANSGVRIYDLADPVNPVDAGLFFADCWEPKVAASGDRAFLLSGNTLIDVDITDPLSPVEISRRALGGRYHGYDLVLDGDRLFVSMGFFEPGRLLVFVVEDHGALTQVGEYVQSYSKWGRDLEIDGTALYVTASGAGVDVLDVTDGTTPSLIGSILGGRSVRQLLAHDDVVYAMLEPPSGIHVMGFRIDAIRRQCSTTVPIVVQEFTAAWLDGATHVTWSTSTDLVMVRILAIADDRTWVVPWTEDGVRHEAVDRGAPRGESVTYELQILQDELWMTLAQQSLQIPGAQLSLRGPYPNPFNPTTRIDYSVAEAGEMELAIFDAAGRRVRSLVSDRRDPGEHTATWDGRGDAGQTVPAGLYVARLTTAQGVRTAKLLLLK